MNRDGQMSAATVDDQAAAAQQSAGPAGALATANERTVQRNVKPCVRFKQSALYVVLGTLIEPKTLVPRHNLDFPEVVYSFNLTQQQITEILANRDYSDCVENVYGVQVHFRCCLFDLSCDQEDCFPAKVIVKVNNSLCFMKLGRNVGQPGPPQPLNVTIDMVLKPGVRNNVSFNWRPDNEKPYCIGLYLIKKLKIAQLLQCVQMKDVIPAVYTRAVIMDKFFVDQDSEIVTTMLKVSLICPLSKLRMTLPCRASTCTHLQCFDAGSYMQMNECNPKWICPVCWKPAAYEDLVIDGYFQKILCSPRLKKDDIEIELHTNGAWSTKSLRENVKTFTQKQPISFNGQDAIVDLTLSDADDDDFALSLNSKTVSTSADNSAWSLYGGAQQNMLDLQKIENAMYSDSTEPLKIERE